MQQPPVGDRVHVTILNSVDPDRVLHGLTVTIVDVVDEHDTDTTDYWYGYTVRIVAPAVVG